MAKTAIVILGHGSRAAEANQGLYEIADIVRNRCGLPVEAAFMSHGKPDLTTAIDRVIVSGAEKVVVVPLFLFSGIHVKKDIPEVLKKEQERLGNKARLIYAQSLGADPRIAEIVIDRIKEVS
ncbi:sirohydrochlorin chelatase [Calderihabitans maritimus]|uniref:Cobalamin (Vitamin B12) biosynthesis CbiX protein n=1 Tax=Calderihabitans maritimus TaxID=1246530 RepID=A0A1Z5HQC9_9FIRM|nr:CbiX/SirB N-terminal domain-containing protein [Calderihabitans maritimus]GAW91521.1 hypothetical protein Desaci_2440 [Calderihabitans maritimus]